MSKITLNNVGSLLDATTAATTINNNSAVIVTAYDNTLSRDGTSPNQMGASLDMNSNKILNLPVPASDAEPVRKKEFDSLIINGGGIVSVNGKTGVVVLSTDDVSDTLAHKYTTSTDITRLANTSGTNTGDQTNITGNAGTATKLQVARAINGVNFDGTIDITVSDNTKVPSTRLVNTYPLSTDITLTKSDVGLGNVDNTSDVTKNSATATLTGKTIDGGSNTITNVTNIKGTATNDNAAAGYVGEFISSFIPTTSPVSLTNNVVANITSITLSPGDWDIYGWVNFFGAVSTTQTSLIGGISDTSASFGTTLPFGLGNMATPSQSAGGSTNTISAGPVRISTTSSPTYYLVARATFATSTLSCSGAIRARRIR